MSQSWLVECDKCELALICTALGQLKSLHTCNIHKHIHNQTSIQRYCDHFAIFMQDTAAMYNECKYSLL